MPTIFALKLLKRWLEMNKSYHGNYILVVSYLSLSVQITKMPSIPFTLPGFMEIEF